MTLDLYAGCNNLSEIPNINFLFNTMKSGEVTFIVHNAMIRSKTTNECGDEHIRLRTTGDEYVRVGIVQETSTYERLEVRRRVHMSA